MGSEEVRDGASSGKGNGEAKKAIGFGHMISPEQGSNIFSKLTFWWANRLPMFAYRNVLQMEHLWQVTDKDQAHYVYDEMNTAWRDQLKLPIPSFGGALWQKYKWYYIRVFFFMLMNVGATLAQPELLSRLTEWIILKKANLPVNENDGYMYAMGMFLIAMFGSFCTYQANYTSVRVGSKLRSSVITNVYRKSLMLSNGAKNKTSQGNIVNIMANDAQRLVDINLFMNNVICAPVQVVAAIILLYLKIGWPTFVAFGFMVMGMPINGIVARRMGSFRRNMVIKSDLRIKITTEIIQYIKVIKLYAWEDSFAQRVIEARVNEIKHIGGFNRLRALLISVISAVPTVSAILMFCAYWGSGHDLNAAIVFSSLAYLNSLALPFNFIPFLAALFVQMKVAAGRVTTFLLLDEISLIDEIKDPNIPVPTITILDADFNWDVPKEEKKPEEIANGEAKDATPASPNGEADKKDNRKSNRKSARKSGPPAGEELPTAPIKKYPEFTLKDTNVHFSGPQLVAVVGPVGSGKSSLCNSLLGEMKLLKGSVAKKGTIAYVPQQAWIINASLRENILFFSPYDEKRYNEVLDACALRPDLQILSAGDMTEIGERGINLSGGQKQRVSIARALYNNADIYIMDDPLSAVDAHVGKHLFYECIKRYLSTKLVILATNQLQFLPDTDHVIVMGGGSIAGQGKFKDLMEASESFREMMHSAGGGGHSQNEDKAVKEVKPKAEAEKKDKSSDQGNLIIAEDRERGSVGLQVYLEYFKAGGTRKGIFVAVIFFALIGSNAFTQWWLSYWTSNQPSDSGSRPDYFYFVIYIALGVFYVIVATMKAFTMIDWVTTAGFNLHNRLFNVIIRAPMWFFDVTPLGRLINRFSKDVDQLDQMLYMVMDQTINFSLTLVAYIILIAIIIPIILAVVGPCLVFYILLQSFYRNTSRELQRIESISRSPIFAQFSETLSGSASIRAYHCYDRMVTVNEHLLNNNNKAYFTLQAMNQWLGIRLDLIGNIIIFTTAIFIIVFRDQVTPAECGLALSLALTTTNYLNRATLASSDLETKMNSAERILASCDGPVEPPSTPNNEPEASWPTTGDITFENYKMRYREGLDLVIRGISCSIQSREKIGIVGRTGAGKSSIVLALFRLVEAAEGKIELDHKDIAQIGLKFLRGRIAIIPQDPVLFSGTLRENLDPFTKLDDAEIWRVLDHVQLKVAAENAGGLYSTVTENGDNWSVGQRQLICLCRALLRKPKILVLDEATASVDSITDALIQKTIRSEFADATILTIAHRLNTIMDSSRIIVMDKGTIAEFDTPSKLIENPDSHLNWLIDQTGAKNAAILRDIAYGRASVVQPQMPITD